MGYLLLFRPGIRTIAACLEETIIPRVIGKDASAVEAIWQDLWRATMTYGRGGIATMAMSALDIALWDALGKRAKLPLHRLWGHYRAQLPAYGSGCFRGSRRRRHDRQGAALQGARLQGDQDAGRAHRRSRHRSRQCQAHARGGRAGHRHHDRRQYGLDRRRRHPDGPQISGLRRVLAGGAGGAGRFRRLSAHRRKRSTCASSAARRISPASISSRFSKIRGCRSCSPIRCAAGLPNCARSRPSPTPGA